MAYYLKFYKKYQADFLNISQTAKHYYNRMITIYKYEFIIKKQDLTYCQTLPIANTIMIYSEAMTLSPISVQPTNVVPSS